MKQNIEKAEVHLYEAVLKDASGNEIRAYREQTSVDFNEWRYLKAINVLKPKGEILEFYLDGVQQFFNDEKASK